MGLAGAAAGQLLADLRQGAHAVPGDRGVRTDLSSASQASLRPAVFNLGLSVSTSVRVASESKKKRVLKASVSLSCSNTVTTPNPGRQIWASRSSTCSARSAAPGQHVDQERHGELKEGERTLLWVLDPGQADDAQAQEGQVWRQAADGPYRCSQRADAERGALCSAMASSSASGDAVPA
jgi:hypothetical protein